MRRGHAFTLVVLVVVLAGCGGGYDGEETGASPPVTQQPSADSRPREVPTEPGETTVPDEPEAPPGGGSNPGGGGGSAGGGGTGGGSTGGGSEDDREIAIGGPTLDNTYPTNPFALPEVGRSSCVVFTNPRSDLPVTVRSVELRDQRPSGDPGLALGRTPSRHGQCGADFYPPGLRSLADECTDAVLEPEQRTGCPVEVRSTGTVGTDYTAILVVQLSATCTSLADEPCVRLSGRARPSPSEPVIVTWTDTRRYCSCLVPRERDGAEFLSEESQGRCPRDDPSEEPSVDTSTEVQPDPADPGPSEEPDQSRPSDDGDGAP